MTKKLEEMLNLPDNEDIVAKDEKATAAVVLHEGLGADLFTSLLEPAANIADLLPVG